MTFQFELTNNLKMFDVESDVLVSAFDVVMLIAGRCTHYLYPFVYSTVHKMGGASVALFRMETELS